MSKEQRYTSPEQLAEESDDLGLASFALEGLRMVRRYSKKLGVRNYLPRLAEPELTPIPVSEIDPDRVYGIGI